MGRHRHGIPLSSVVWLTAVALFLATAATGRAATNAIHVVELVDSTGGVTYETMPAEEYQNRKAETVIRNRRIRKAIEQAKEEWNATHKGVVKPFPNAVAKPESVNSIGRFVSEDSANATLSELRAKARQRREAGDARQSTAEKNVQATQGCIDDLKATPASKVENKTAKVAAGRRWLRFLKRDLEKKKARDLKQAEDRYEARAMFNMKLAALEAEAAK